MTGDRPFPPAGSADRDPGAPEASRLDGSRRRAPVVYRCCAPGCGAYACYGQNVRRGGDPARERWWCAAHVPADFFRWRDAAAGDGPDGPPEPPRDGKQTKLEL